MKSFFCSLLFLSVLHSTFACNQQVTSFFSKKMLNSPDRVFSLPGLGCVDDLELAGLLPVTRTKNTIKSKSDKTPSLFYWFVESREHSDNTPLVLWLSGGPGAASTYAFFLENGPYSIADNGTLITQQHSWTNHANYLIIDQPAGVGLSYGNKGDYSNENKAMDQLYEAIQVLFKRYPELASKPLYLAGESYAAKYIPELAMRILAGNTVNNSIHLKGILIGDGWVNPRIQQSTDADFAYSHGLIDLNTHKKVAELYQQCADEIDRNTPSSRQANQTCNEIQAMIKRESGIHHMVNIHTGKEPDDKLMISYLNQPDVRKALHIEHASEFRTFNELAADTLEIGEQDSVADLYSTLLDNGIRVMIYNGLYDGTDCNFMGTDKWLSVLQWSKSDEFSKAKTCPWSVNKNVVGSAKTASGLTQIKVQNAGHLAPADQPEILEKLLATFIASQPFCLPE